MPVVGIASSHEWCHSLVGWTDEIHMDMMMVRYADKHGHATGM